uniref:Uncharacterized protein n=1 Tax=Mycena chlorophos TaxID=658473 RepID=A0ABQ0LDI5_MYCCL|nr:predicted protein [Mycena chlorophos]
MLDAINFGATGAGRGPQLARGYERDVVDPKLDRQRPPTPVHAFPGTDDVPPPVVPKVKYTSGTNQPVANCVDAGQGMPAPARHHACRPFRPHAPRRRRPKWAKRRRRSAPSPQTDATARARPHRALRPSVERDLPRVWTVVSPARGFERLDAGGYGAPSPQLDAYQAVQMHQKYSSPQRAAGVRRRNGWPPIIAAIRSI